MGRGVYLDMNLWNVKLFSRAFTHARTALFRKSHLHIVVHFLPGRGGLRGRGGFLGRGRGRGRGRGAGRPAVTREQLDNQLDAYMSKTKGHLDAELDAYMAQADPESME